MITVEQAKELIKKARMVNVIRSSIPGQAAVAELPEIQCDPNGIKSPQHYRELLNIIATHEVEEYNTTIIEVHELREENSKLKARLDTAINDLREERKYGESLKKRLILATEQVLNPPANSSVVMDERKPVNSDIKEV